MLGVIGLAFWAGDAAVMSRAAGSSLPRLDAATATISLVAQYLMTRKCIENWAMWVAHRRRLRGDVHIQRLVSHSRELRHLLVLAVMGHIAWRRVARRHGGRIVAPPATA